LISNLGHDFPCPLWPFPALSVGMQTYIGWLGDLLFQLVAVATPARRELCDIGGMVMVDEIDLLLHPSWQRTVMPRAWWTGSSFIGA
jgi:predicted ATP-binding protein involved in virulence